MVTTAWYQDPAVWTQAVAFIGAVTAFVKVVWPRIKSTDNAVNHGRLEGMEKDLTGHVLSSGERMKALEEQIDRNEQMNASRHEAINKRLDQLMLAMVPKQ